MRASIILATGAALLLTLSAAAAPLKAPVQVKKALQSLASVQADMKTKAATQAWARLPPENPPFQQAAQALRDSIANEPVSFRESVEKRLVVATHAVKNVAELSSTRDDAKIAAALAAVDAALQPLDKLFPQSLRPKPPAR